MRSPLTQTQVLYKWQRWGEGSPALVYSSQTQPKPRHQSRRWYTQHTPAGRPQLFEAWRELLKSLFGLFEASFLPKKALAVCPWPQTPPQAVGMTARLEKWAPGLWRASGRIRIRPFSEAGRTPQCCGESTHLSWHHPRPVARTEPCLQALLCPLPELRLWWAELQDLDAALAVARAPVHPALRGSLPCDGRRRRRPRPPGVHAPIYCCCLCDEWNWKRGEGSSCLSNLRPAKPGTTGVL